MKNVEQMRLWSGTTRELFSRQLIFSFLALLATLLLAVMIGVFSPTYSIAVMGIIIVAIVVLLRLDALTVTLIIAAHIVVDLYLNFDVYQIALLIAVILLFACYFWQSMDHPWTAPRSIWLWFLFLLLNIPSIINGSVFSLTNAIAFYLNLVLSAFVIFWLGNIVAKDISVVRRVFQLFSVLASLIAIHTIIEATTGKFLFETAQAEATLIKYSYFHAQGAADITRAGSFFSNPDANGAFLATSFFLSLGLFIESKHLLAKMIYLLETLLILLALLFTYSTGSWIATILSIVALMFLLGRMRYIVLLLIFTVMLAGIAFTVFPSQMASGLNHANNQGHLTDHLGTWQTAARVIEAFPLSGVGLGDEAYLVRAEPYRVAAQATPQTEPDTSYLQWGATGGIPVMLVFLLLLGRIFWFSWRNWRTIDIRYRSLLGGGIVAILALSINSLVVDGWTNPDGVAILGWLIAGLVSSPLIGRSLLQQSDSSIAKTTEVMPVQDEISRMDKAKGWS